MPLEATRGSVHLSTLPTRPPLSLPRTARCCVATPLSGTAQLPDWVKAISDKTELTEVIENHIAEVAGHFKGKCFAWVSHTFHDCH